jgi:hypothetical protein
MEEIINGYRVTYPKDPKGGGTWFAIREDGVALVLLNGAFWKHLPNGPYAMSRGLVLLKLMGKARPEAQFFKMDLTRIEPFTLILFHGHKLVEMRWDGKMKHQKGLDPNGDHIWSSVTLYDQEVAQQRKLLFDGFLKEKENKDENGILDFHRSNNYDFENGFATHRNNGLRTVSITQAVFNGAKVGLSHFNLLDTQKKPNFGNYISVALQ